MSLYRSHLARVARHRWPRIKRILPWAVLTLAVGLLAYFGSSVDWPGVWQAVRRIPRQTLLLAAALVPPAYLAYAALDLLGRRYTGHTLPWPKVLGVAMLSYALNLNLGVLLGGLGARLRLYARLGCRKATATRVAVFSAVSNGIGYGWVAGVVFASGAIVVPAGWEIGGGMLRLLGLGLLAAAGLYVWICARARRRTAVWMGQRVSLPGGRMAVLQSVTAALSWLLMGAIMYLLLQAKVSYPVVLGILLCTSFAAVVTRVPGGLGTTEAIFVAALSSRLPAAEVLGAALSYRALYALAPLCLALLAFAAVEARLGWRGRQRLPDTNRQPGP